MNLRNLFRNEQTKEQREEQAVHDKLSDDNFELV